MDIEDFATSEVAIASGVTALVLHPKVRRVMRRGLVLGLAGALGVVEATKAGVSQVRHGSGLGADLMHEAQDVRSAHAQPAKTQRGRSHHGHDTGAE